MTPSEHFSYLEWLLTDENFPDDIYKTLQWAYDVISMVPGFSTGSVTADFTTHNGAIKMVAITQNGYEGCYNMFIDVAGGSQCIAMIPAKVAKEMKKLADKGNGEL